MASEDFLSGDLNNYARSLQVHSSTNVEELLEFIRSLPGPIGIQNIYASGTRHYVWFTTNSNVKIVKKKKTKNRS